VPVIREDPGDSNQKVSRNVSGPHATPMSPREARTIAENAEWGLFPAEDIGIRRVVDEAHRTLRAATKRSRPDARYARRERVIVGLSVGAGTAVIAAVIWFLPILAQQSTAGS
jgi:hypothetical protein